MESIRGKYQTPEEVLRSGFGLQEFRTGQREVIQAVMAGRDTLAVMPTGSGKSICYSIPGALGAKENGATLVVSPLIALMRDQVRALREAGMVAVTLHSGLEEDDRAKIETRIRKGKGLDFVYLTPESLQNSQLRESVAQGRVLRLAVDEAHCVSSWGPDFRPDYLGIGPFAAEHNLQVIACTATAGLGTREDIIKRLRLEDPFVHVADPRRKNLGYETRRIISRSLDDSRAQKYTLLSGMLAKAHGGKAVVYCSSTTMTEVVANRLRTDHGLRSAYYHGQMDKGLRKATEAAFANDQLEVLIATSAFGMGVDIPNIRSVFHYDLPDSPLALLQETGRAGRDGEPADCTLLYDQRDSSLLEWRLNSLIDYPFIKKLRGKLLYQMNSQGSAIGRPFKINFHALYYAMGVSDDPEGKSKVSRAIKLLTQYGHLSKMDTKEGERVYFGEAVDLEGEKEGILKESLETGRKARAACARQIIEYAEGEASQDRLAEMMERNVGE